MRVLDRQLLDGRGLNSPKTAREVTNVIKSKTAREVTNVIKSFAGSFVFVGSAALAAATGAWGNFMLVLLTATGAVLSRDEFGRLPRLTQASILLVYFVLHQQAYVFVLLVRSREFGVVSAVLVGMFTTGAALGVMRAEAARGLQATEGESSDSERSSAC